jgi:catecholate siderophore receptor
MAQSQPSANGATQLPVVVVKEKALEPEGKDSLQIRETSIGKGKQALRDIPQSITVVTERLMDDRNLDTVKEALKNTAGISFLAAEGGEEDIRLRGFALQSTGDVFVDGMRDPAFYDRDTFNLDRLEVLRGSASMLFGRGSTGGAVNQVNKVPRLMDENQVDLTVGNHNVRRAVADFNLKTGDSAGLRLSAMVNKADNNGAGSAIDKQGVALAYRTGIGEKNEFQASLYHLNYQNGMNYGMPWIRPSANSEVSDTGLLPLDPTSYFGMGSDRNDGRATLATLSHTYRLDNGDEIKTQVRRGEYMRDQRAGTVRLCRSSVNEQGALVNPTCPSDVSLDNFGPATQLTRGTNLKIQDLNTLYAQSDYSGKFNAGGLRHEVLAGIDYAREVKTVYGARSKAQGGVDLSKPTTWVSTPADGASIDEASRVLRTTSDYTSQGAGIYAQDLIQLSSQWKLLAGLRFDTLEGDYSSYAIPGSAAGPVSTSRYTMNVNAWSQRAGLIYQPNDRSSFHLSAASSFNTSGDAYSLSAANVDTPPEQSVNVELGGRLESADKRFSTRFAVFRSTKYHERNTDPLVDLVTLSGKRHVMGLEVDVAGRITPQWEIYASYMFLPDAKIDQGVAGSEGEGTRPSLTPRHSGTLWSTYQLTSQWRVGAGLTFRGEQTPNRNPGWTAPAFVTADLMAEFQQNESLIWKLNISNVTNKLYADALYTGHYIPGPGRQVQLTASLKF